MAVQKALRRNGAGFAQILPADQIICDAGAMTVTETGGVEKSVPDAFAAKRTGTAPTSADLAVGTSASAIPALADLPNAAILAKDTTGLLLTLTEAVKFQGIQLRSEAFIEQYVSGIGNWQQVGKSNGTTGNGLDETAALAAAGADCSAKGIPLTISPGKHRTTALVTFPDPVTMRWASSPVAYNFGGGSDNLKTKPGTAPAGSWFYLDHTGPGLLLGGSYATSGFNVQAAFIRNQPAPGAGWAPFDHDFDIVLGNARGELDVVHLNATRGVYWGSGGYGQVSLKQRGQCFKLGARIQDQFDIAVKIFQNLWTHWSMQDDVLFYQSKNLNCLQMHGVDNSMIEKMFAIYCANQLLFFNADNPGQPGQNLHGNFGHKVQEMSCDGCSNSAVYVEPGSTLMSLVIDDFEGGFNRDPFFVNRVPYADQRGYMFDINGSNAKININTLSSAGCPDGVARLLGSNNRMAIKSIQDLPLGWNRNGLGAAAFTADGANNNLIDIQGAINFTPTAAATRANLFSGTGIAWSPGIKRQVLGETGYTLYNDGKLVQWGVTSGGDVAVTFPRPYTGGACNSVNGNVRNVSDSSKIYGWGYNNLTATGFTARPRYSAGGSGIAGEPFEWRSEGYVPV